MSMIYNTLGIVVTPKEGERFYFDFGLDNEDSAWIKAPNSMDVFKGVTKTSQLLKVLNNFFINEGSLRDEEGNWHNVEFHLLDLIEHYDFDKEYPKFRKKVNALKTLDQIASITVFTNNDVCSDRKYDWAKFDFEKNEMKSGTDYAKNIDNMGFEFEPSQREMFDILANK